MAANRKEERSLLKGIEFWFRFFLPRNMDKRLPDQSIHKEKVNVSHLSRELPRIVRDFNWPRTKIHGPKQRFGCRRRLLAVLKPFR